MGHRATLGIYRDALRPTITGRGRCHQEGDARRPFTGRPVEGPTILTRPCPDFVRKGQPFGYDPTYPTPDHIHKGQDWEAPLGTPVWFREAGVVRWCKDTGQLGNYIAISCDRSPNEYWGVAHLSEMIVTVGQHVAAGEIVGYSGGVPGDPGAGLTTGPHIHEERWVEGLFNLGHRVDPGGE